MILRYILCFIVVLLIGNTTYSQKISDGLYINQTSGEFMYMHNDSIAFRICNHDAFDTFAIGRGQLVFKGNETYVINSDTSLAYQMSVIDTTTNSDTLTSITLLYQDETPMVYTQVSFQSVNNKELEFSYISDTNGMVVLDNDAINHLSHQKCLLKIKTLGFSTENTLRIKQRCAYILHATTSQEYPFTLFETGKIFMNINQYAELEVSLSNSKRKRKQQGVSRLRKINIEHRFSYPFLQTEQVKLIFEPI